MKTVSTFLLLFQVFLATAQIGPLKLASDTWPPFTDEKGKRAFAFDLVKEALAGADIKVQMDILKNAEVVNEIRSGRYDGSAALWYSKERAEFLLFSDPYLENRLVLVGKKGSNVGASSFSELKGKKIAVVETYAYGETVDQAKEVKLVSGKNDQQNLNRLLKGEVDYMLVDALLIEYLLTYQSTDVSKYLSIGSNTMLKHTLHFAIRKETPGADSIVRKFNEEIRKMVTQGTYNRILQINWITTDVDGDGQIELVLNGNQAGTKAPSSSYMLISPPPSEEEVKVENTHYYIEGNMYENWDRVPDKYKVPQKTFVQPDPQRGFGISFSVK